MRWELKSIGIWTVIKVGFFFHLITGFVLGLLYGIFFLFLVMAGGMPELAAAGVDVGALSGGVALFAFPIMFSIGGAIFGTVFSLIAAVVYNLIARVLGGLEFSLATIGEVRPITPAQPAPAAAHYPPPPPPPPANDAPVPRREPTAPPPPPPRYRDSSDDDITQPVRREPPTDRPVAPPPSPPEQPKPLQPGTDDDAHPDENRRPPSDT